MTHVFVSCVKPKFQQNSSIEEEEEAIDQEHKLTRDYYYTSREELVYKFALQQVPNKPAIVVCSI